MVGRMDMKAERKTGVLNIKGLWLEPGVRASAGRKAKIEAEIERIRKFANMNSVFYRSDWFDH